MIQQIRTRTVFSLAAVTMAILVLTTSTASAGQAELLSAVSALKDHIDGTTPLSPGQIETHKLTIDSNSALFGDNDTIIAACFDLVETYDTEIGPLWVAGSPIQSFDRNSASDSDIHWAVYNVMQYIMDGTYTNNNVLAYPTLFDGFKFGSSAHFPGAADPPANPEVTHTATINGSFPDTYGRDTMHWLWPARKPTGTYLAPGTIVTITVPSSMVGEGYQVRIGCHSWDFSNRSVVKRLDRSTILYDIDSTQVKVASPLGGGIYIEVPYLADAGVVDIEIKNAVRSPYFSAKSFHTTTLSEWQTTERNHPGPWADFQSEKFMMNVPTDWIYNLDDPVTLMADWDKATDATNDLMGFPRDRGKESHYPQVDLLLRVPYHAPGYPSINVTYNPNTNYGGNHSYFLLTGPQNAGYYEFHEQGHAYLFTKFPGEVESNVNLLHVAVWHQKFGYPLDVAFEKSMNYNIAYRTLDTTSVCWMMCQNFKNNLPMEQLEKQYQLKGHAKFVEIARLFGWGVLGDYWKSFNDDYENSIPIDDDIDSLLLRLSKAVGVDIRPLFHFWGIHPINAAALADAIAAEDLEPSLEIYNTLVKYKSFIPPDNAAYQAFATAWWGGSPPSPDGYMTEQYHASIWDTYDEAYAELINNNVQYIIDLYFPYGAPKDCDYTCGDIDGSGDNADMGDFAEMAICWGTDPIADQNCICANLVEFDKHIIDLLDLSVLAELFLSTSPDYPPNDCSASITDPYPPTPDPMSFLTPPYATDGTSIEMVATQAKDISGVEYYFTCTAGGGHDSGWQYSTSYEDTGLTVDTQYTYTVKARDKSDVHNETAASSAVSETTFAYENLVLPANGGILESFTSEYGDGWVASDLTNGVTNEDGWSSTENPTSPQEFIFSFRDGNSATLNEAVIHGGTAEGWYYSKDVEVRTSVDGSSYTLAGGGTLANSNGSTVTVDLTGIVAQKIKLAVTSGYQPDYWELAEFVVNGVIID